VAVKPFESPTGRLGADGGRPPHPETTTPARRIPARPGNIFLATTDIKGLTDGQKAAIRGLSEPGESLDADEEEHLLSPIYV
jgi:hypothetical protein